MGGNLLANYGEAVAMILFGIGFSNLLLQKNLISEKVLFSADGFGKFGAMDAEDDEGWACEARRYYFNIVGRYGASVQALLKKAAKLDIAVICPLHGPVLNENLDYYIGLYDTWSSYKPENSGVLIAYASIHGNTAKAARKLGDNPSICHM